MDRSEGLIAFVCSLLFMGACTPPFPSDVSGLPLDVAGELGVGGSGCLDIYLYNRNPQSTFAASASFDAPLEDVTEGVATHELRYDLSRPEDRGDVTVRLSVGRRLMQGACDDQVLPGPGPRVRQSWSAVDGVGILTIYLDRNPYEPIVDFTLTNGVFAPEGGGDEVAVEELRWEGVTVGWLPG